MIRKSNAPTTSKVRDNKKQYNGFYYGIVIQNNDPLKGGRVKVYIPHISPTIYERWTEDNKDKKWKFIGENIGSDLTSIVEQLKDILPWADCAAPLIGQSSSGRYHAKTKTGSISDSSKISKIKEDPNYVPSDTALNMDGIGESTGRVFERTKPNDAFNDAVNSNEGDIISGIPNKLNKNAFNYTPSTYSNAAKGMFSIPGVGAHVWVFFREGNPMCPVYFATSFDEGDWKSVYQALDSESPDYPGGYENSVQNSSDCDTDIYRNKLILNQKGGSMEIVSTDNKELLKLTHFNGSFLEFNNEAMMRFSSNDDCKLILGDQFHTIRGDRSEYSDGDYDLIVRGDQYTKIGNFNKDGYQQWKDIVQNIADTKQLFEIKRANFIFPGADEIRFIQTLSPSQTRSGTFALCPLCSSGQRDSFWHIKNSIILFRKFRGLPPTDFGAGYPDATSNFTGINPPSLFRNVVSIPFGAKWKLTTGGKGNFLNDGVCPVCSGTGFSTSTQNGNWNDAGKDKLIKDQISATIADLAKIEQKFGLGGSELRHITKHKTETIGLLLNNFPALRIDPVGKMVRAEVQVFKGGVVDVPKPSPLIEQVHVDDLPGGTYSLNVCNRMNVMVGAGGIDFKSIGSVNIGGTITNIAGEQVNIVSENEINIHGEKRLSIIADIISIRQKNYGQVLVESNLGVSQNVVIGGACHIEGELSVNHITAPMEIQETEETVLQGWIPAAEIPAKLYQFTSGGVPAPIFANGPVKVNIIGHSHQFRNVPLTLCHNSEDVRTVGKGANFKNKRPAFPVAHEKKGGQAWSGTANTETGTKF
tara:strand:- start:7917 stop:10355 length:2439 start_codon:yes stop_codon:yes gene_type:complete